MTCNSIRNSTRTSYYLTGYVTVGCPQYSLLNRFALHLLYHPANTPSHAPPFFHPKFPRARPDILDPVKRKPLHPCQKTLGFGPVLPHTRFETVNTPSAAGLCLHNDHTDLHAVALHFMPQYNDLESGWAYVIHPESYTDKATGFTHVYARQIVGGIEVADAHVNLNIKDGDSVHILALSLPWWRAHPTCRDVREGLATLEHLHSFNCANVPSFGLSGQVDLDMDPRRPLLAFLPSALPEDHPELSSVLDNAEEHASKMVMTSETHLLGDHSILGMGLNNVPGAVCEVKARLVWVQVLSENGVHLELVHRIEVEMEHNWYETTDTASLALLHRERRRLGERLANVITRCNRGSRQAYAPTPNNPGPPKFSKATYEVFPWGVNDPVEAPQRDAERHGQTEVEHPLSYGRQTVKELGDTLASPAGWHTLPVSRDLSVGESDRAAMGECGHAEQNIILTTILDTSRRFVLAHNQHDMG
ncbi:hypothetical protein PAXINDRAFT_103813 [Paxillus involutus ATCC 200175]|uniref:FTP domain-containing protein n=1 Tax=Paxillus involutus ATCC 200175 TaxID=664439 RepID=A0A0C9TDL3_PAXIN|nr:hypothetical protein PAXINDRAFT_103813 [Paxillus involutus ATCC 200175]